jgi:hypothetical protein
LAALPGGVQPPRPDGRAARGAGLPLYFAVRGAVVDRPEVAYRHALDVIDAQRSLGIFWEDDMNDWIKDRQFLAQTANIVYFWLHFPLIIAFGIYLYYGQRSKYTLMRDAFLLSGAIALVIYWLYPVAPPRELPELAARFDNGGPVYVRGFFDTMQEYLGYGYQAQSTQAFVNPYAAMPSLHFGWDLLLGIGIVWASWRQRLMWLTLPIGVFLPLSQIPAITVTANHFFLDAAAGASSPSAASPPPGAPALGLPPPHRCAGAVALAVAAALVPRRHRRRGWQRHGGRRAAGRRR